VPPPLIGCVCLCSYIESSSPMTTIPPATFATRNLTTANKTSTATAAADADDNVKEDDENDDGWMESRPDDSTYNYPSTPAQSYSTSQGYVCTTD